MIGGSSTVENIWSLLLACFGCLVGEELDRYSACRQGADLDIKKDSRRAIDGGGHFHNLSA